MYEVVYVSVLRHQRKNPCLVKISELNNVSFIYMCVCESIEITTQLNVLSIRRLSLQSTFWKKFYWTTV